MTTIPTLVAAATLAAATFTACGGESEEDRVRNAVDEAHETFAGGDDDAICKLLKASGLAGSDDQDTACVMFIRLLDEMPDDQREAFADIEVKRVRIDGDRAFIRAEDVRYPPELDHPSMPRRPILVVRRGGEWQVKAVKR